MLNKNKQSGFAIVILLGLVVAVGAMGFAGFNVYKKISEDNTDFAESQSEIEGNEALEKYVAEEAEQNTTSSSGGSVEKNVVGNTNSSKKPTISAGVKEPTTSIEGLRTFVQAIKDKDFVTANGLMGPSLASEFAKLAGTDEASKALEECDKDTTCSLVLESFNPPESKYTVKSFTPKYGDKGEQISFLLSDSAPLISSLLATDENIDVMMESYQGVWTVQNIFVGGKSLNEFTSAI